MIPAPRPTSVLHPFPVMLDLRGRDALVIGADEDAARRAARLSGAGARVLVLCSGPVPPGMQALATEGCVHIEESGAGLRPEQGAPPPATPPATPPAPAGCVHIEARPPLPEDVDGKALVYVATSEEALAPPLFERARARGQLLCTIDRPELSTFINPAVAELGAIAVALSTGGASPALASRLRQDLEALLGTATFARFVDELRAHREALPRGERAREAAAKVNGFAVRGEIAYPPWFDAK